MKQSFYVAAAAVILLASCTTPFKKVESGIEYKIISDGKGKVIKAGNFFEIEFSQTYKGANKDTVLFSSKETSSQIVPLDSTNIPPVYYKIFSQIRKGDSIIVRQLTDSVMKGGNTPPFMKKGAYIIAYYKILNIYETKDAADSAFKKQMVIAKANDSIKAAEQLKKDDKVIADYLKSKNIQAVKGKLGTYVQIINPGEGDALDTSKVLKVFYTGKTLDEGKVFDSNTDSSFRHMDALPVDLGAQEGAPGSVIKGWTDGLYLLKKGAKAVLYVPSSLAYGRQGAGGQIKPNANLVFDVEISDVINAAQARAEAEGAQKKMMEKRKHVMDSMQKVQRPQDGSK